MTLLTSARIALSWSLVIDLSVILIQWIAQTTAQIDRVGLPGGVGGLDDSLTQVNTVREMCHYSRFEAQCGRDEVLVFRRAVYGRMRVGGCVQTNFGFVGCSLDVLDILDRRCTGRQSCQFDVVEPTFENRRPCNIELKNYLEVEYTCLQVVQRRVADPADPGALAACQLLLTQRESVLPVTVRSVRQSYYTIVSGSPGTASTTRKSLSTLPGSEMCGTETNPWNVVAARPGQRINITAIDLTSSATTVASIQSLVAVTMATGPCRRYLRLRDSRAPLDGRRVTSSPTIDRSDCEFDDVVTGNGGGRPIHREMFVFSTFSRNIEIVIEKNVAPEHFLLTFKLIGCADVSPLPDKSWVRYAPDRSAALVGCEHSGTTEAIWRLECELDTWSGYVGNCSALPADSSSVATFSSRYDPFKLNGASIALIWLCIAVAISLCVLILGLAVYKRIYKRPSSARCKSSNSLPQSAGTPSHQSPSSTHDLESRPVCDQLTDANCQFYHAFVHSGLYASVRIQQQSGSSPGRHLQQRIRTPDFAASFSGRQLRSPATGTCTEAMTVFPAAASAGRTRSWSPTTANAVDLTSDCPRVVAPASTAGCDCRCETMTICSEEIGAETIAIDTTTATLGSIGRLSTAAATRTKPRSVLVVRQPFKGSCTCQTADCAQCSAYNITVDDVR